MATYKFNHIKIRSMVSFNQKRSFFCYSYIPANKLTFFKFKCGINA